MNAGLAGLLFISAIIAWMLFRILKYRGLGGAFFGARIERTVGEVVACGGRTWSVKMKVYELNDNVSDKAIGLAVITKGLGSYESSAVTLPASGAMQLATLIESSLRR
jgi:hypothetical protein